MIDTRFLPAAEAEFLKEIGYYSNVREGLGIRFQLSERRIYLVAPRRATVGVAKVTANRVLASAYPCAHAAPVEFAFPL